MKKRVAVALMGFLATVSLPVDGLHTSTASARPRRMMNREVPEEQKAEYLKKGADITAATGKAMGGTLMSTLKEQGPVAAAQFCNVKAPSIVGDLQKEHHVLISRKTLKPRNPKNQANRQEAAIINQYMADAAAGKQLEPIVMKTGSGRVAYYAPIKIATPVCLKCHGTVGHEVAEADYAEIKKLYPRDKAINYKEGDLRGIWSIVFLDSDAK